MYYKLSRFSTLHNTLRKAAYSVLWRLPDGLKYGFGSVWRRFRLPYKLLRPGDVAIQIGAPWDTLKAGRSRAAYFTRFVGREGRVVVIEPEPGNVDALNDYCRRHGLRHMQVLPKGAWSKATRLRFLVHPDHPASNLVEEVCDDNERDRTVYDITEIDVESVDNIVAELGAERVRMLSVTTNGSELEILKGAAQALRKIEYVSIITDAATGFLAEHGFRQVGHDDHGYTYRRTDA